MSLEPIQSRLSTYTVLSQEDEWNAVREISQEIVLASLSRAGLFKDAAFQGGTCLRIIHGLPRFSEDLDFILLRENSLFRWQPYSNHIIEDFRAFGLEMTIQDRSQLETNVKSAFIKQDSIGKMLSFKFARDRSHSGVVRIKLEVDARPPAGSEYETKFVDFPYPFSLVAQKPSSLFAGKCHALLCRNYTKGRDWFDFAWYVGRGTTINLNFLQNALDQNGPWQTKRLLIDMNWVAEALKKAVWQTDFDQAKADVRRFLRPQELRGLDVWGPEFFTSLVDRLT